MKLDFERFTGRAKGAVENAQDEADALGHNYVGTEHLILALLKQGGSVGFILLQKAGLDYAKAREAVIELLGSSKGK